MHATWRMQLARTDEGVTHENSKGQEHVHTLGLQCTVERNITPRIWWQARADARWRWSVDGKQLASVVATTLNWKPTESIALHIRAIVYASPQYDLSTWVMEYSSPDLQRLLVCSGYGLQLHVSSSAEITQNVRVSALGVLRHDAATHATTVAGYLSCGVVLTGP